VTAGARATGPSASQPSARGCRDALGVAVLAFALRAVVVVWAKERFPPADDGIFYHAVAERIAHGAGYTWLWPDGAVTYAAHYPVGYPALLGLVYALFGARPVVGMLAQAVLGAFAAYAAQRAVAAYGSRRQALIAGLLLALHPGLVVYTPALMTEGVSAELLVIAAWLTVRAGFRRGEPSRLVALGLCAGALTLIRPQLLIMAPVFGFLALDSAQARYRLRALRAGIVTALAIAVCIPWTLRNCARMDRCVFVSANGGWNLLIGSAPEANGSWIPIEGPAVPAACRQVFGEAEKDRCFGHAGLENIRRAPLAFLAKVPQKLSYTFDYFGAPGHYLHASNPAAFDDRSKVLLGAVETLAERLVLLFALLNAALTGKARPGLRLAVAAPSAVFALARAGWLGYLGFALLVVLSGKELLKRPFLALSAALILATAATHAVFFGAGRYGFVCAALLCLAAVGRVTAGGNSLPSSGSRSAGGDREGGDESPAR